MELLDAKYIMTTFAHIYGGGGGGGAAAYDLSLTLGPITVGVYVGGGGGGGAGDGLGGNVPATTFGIFEYVPGQDASNGITSIGTPGEGGEKTTSISRTISVVTITLKPVARGGDGGTYGYRRSRIFCFRSCRIHYY